MYSQKLCSWPREREGREGGREGWEREEGERERESESVIYMTYSTGQ